MLLMITLAWAKSLDPNRELVDAVAASDPAAVEVALGLGADPDAPVWVEPPPPTSTLGRLWQAVTGPPAGRWTSGLYVAADLLATGDPDASVLLDRLLTAGGDPNVVVTGREPLLTGLVRLTRADTPIDAWVHRLLAAGASPDPAGASPVAALARPRTEALQGDERAVLATLLAAAPAAADHALCAVIRARDTALTVDLLPAVSDPNALCPDGLDTPLLAAVRAGHSAVIPSLVLGGASAALAAPPSWHTPIGLAVTERDLPDAHGALNALVDAGADRGLAEADGRTPFELARKDRLSWLFQPGLSLPETAAALVAWAQGADIPTSWLPRPMTDGWTPDLLAPVVATLGRERWATLYAQAGPEVIGEAPHRMGVLSRPLRTSSLACPLQDDTSAATVTGLLGPRLRLERGRPIQVDHLVGGDVTWLRTGSRWELMVLRPAPAACALLPYDLSRSTLAEVEIALGPPDVRLQEAEAWRLVADDPGRSWLWIVEHDAAGLVTGTRLDRRTP